MQTSYTKRSKHKRGIGEQTVMMGNVINLQRIRRQNSQLAIITTMLTGAMSTSQLRLKKKRKISIALA